MMLSSSLTPKAGSAEFLSKLHRIPLFKDLDGAGLLEFQTAFTQSAYPKETIIFYEQDLPERTGSRVYFVLEGCVKLVKYSSDGESTIVRLACAGEFFGVTGALTNQSYPFSAETLTDTTVISINHDNFKKLITRFPSVALNMMCAMGEVLWFNYATHNQVVKKSEARVAKIILHYLKRDGFEQTPEGLQLKIYLPHDYIASMTGIAYEESVRIISRLKKQYQCIRYLRGGKILITNLEMLREVAQDNDSYH